MLAYLIGFIIVALATWGAQVLYRVIRKTVGATTPAGLRAKAAEQRMAERERNLDWDPYD